MFKEIRERLWFARFCTIHRASLHAQEKWQGKRLREVVAHAALHIPLWRTLLSTAGVSSESIRGVEDISKLPITSKETYLGREVEEYIDTSRGVFSHWYVTSGTSGTPFRFLMSEEAVTDKYIDLASYRFLWWKGMSLQKIANLRLARIKIRGPQKKNRLFIPVEDFLKNPRDVFEMLVLFEAEIIAAYPSILLEMAREISRDPTLPKPRPRFVLSFGEMLFPSVRAFVSETLHCEIYDRYGLEEIGAIGVECEKHDGVHINTESVIIEILDDAGSSVAEGTEGRIVATDLLNYGMPFLRYDTGDRGRITREPCVCGLHSPRLFVEGRYSAYLQFPARKIHHLEFDGAMDGFMNAIFKYQIVKKSDSEIIARIIPGPSYHPEIRERVTESLAKLVGESIQIGVEHVDTIPLTPRGKSRIVVDES